MVQLRFEDPPEYRSTEGPSSSDIWKNADREAMIQALCDYPDRWAVVSTHLSRNRAAQVARRLKPRHPSHEFRVARSPDGRGVVYGRYVPTNVSI